MASGKVSELVSQRIDQTVANVKAWGMAFYNVQAKPYEATGDGTTNDTTAVQAAITAAVAAGRKAIYFPHGTYYVTALTNDDQVVFFGDNSTFTGGYTGTINQIGFSLNDNYGADAGATDAYAITIDSSITSYQEGLMVAFKANTANTGACTLNVNSLGAKTIKKNTSDDMETGDIAADQIVVVVYDGTNFQFAGAATGELKAHKAENAIDAHGAMPCARVYHDANQSIANELSTTLAFNSERYDTDTIHDTATNNSRLTCKTAGKYRISAQVSFALNSTGYRELFLLLNGATVIAYVTQDANATTVTNMEVSTTYDLAVNDYVEARVWQNSGGALNVVSGAAYSPEFMMEKVG